MKYQYEHPRGALTVDCVVFGFDTGSLKVLLIKRGLPPFRGKWALPGGFVHLDETLDEAAMRELREETGLRRVFLEQLYTFGAVKRDPRERVVSVAYYALVKLSDHSTQAATDASDARWFPIDALPALAFDHQEIAREALKRLQGKVRYQPIGFELLPEKFTLSQLQNMYETILGHELDKRNFRKKILSFGFIRPLDEYLKEGAHRPAQLFQFEPELYRKSIECGIYFEL